VFLGLVIGFALAHGTSDGSEPAYASQAAASQARALKSSPTKAVSDRDVYYPGTEDLAPDEMRGVACSTGMPSVRPKQAAACWLVELGNGDKFLFDIGSGSHERIAAQKIPYDYLDKVFFGHLHVDHMGDLPSFWLGGTVMNRLTPLRIWGPSGATPEYGTKAAMEHMKKMYVWDIGTRSGVIDFRGGELEVNEFSFDAVNNVIFDENGVVIRTIPAVHGLGGAVSFLLQWNGLKFAFSSDTIPNKWWVEHTKGADISIHECFLPSTLLVTKQGFAPIEGLVVGTQGHTSPEQFGKVMAMTKPRLAVGYHFYNDFDIAPEVTRRVRKTYDGPLALALDYMVFNVTKDDVRVRMSAYDEQIWPSPALKKKNPPDFTKAIPISDFTKSGALALPEVVGPIYEEINKLYGTDYKPAFK
jgi:ribonuclease Z